MVLFNFSEASDSITGKVIRVRVFTQYCRSSSGFFESTFPTRFNESIGLVASIEAPFKKSLLIILPNFVNQFLQLLHLIQFTSGQQKRTRAVLLKIILRYFVR